MSNLWPSSGRERYRLLVSLLVIPLGAIIVIRAVMLNDRAWLLIVLGVAFIGLGVVRLYACARKSDFRWRKRK